MAQYSLLLVDMDGVVWRGGIYVAKNIKALKALQEKYKIVFMTNNSSLTRAECLDKIKAVGISSEISDIYTSSVLAAIYIEKRGVGKTFVIGEAGIYEELIVHGIPVVSEGPKVDYVVVGIDKYLTYHKLSKAANYIMNGATFIATNEDPTYPVGDHLEPGAGAVVNFIKTVVGREPDFVAGKPNTWILDIIVNKYKLKKEEVLVIGDSLHTDVPMGHRYGVDTLLVLTGVTSERELASAKTKPTYVTRDLLEALELKII